MVHEITSLSEYRRALSSRSVVLTCFYGDDCAPCQALLPQLDAWEKQYAQALLLRVNVDKAEEVAAQSRVQGLPTVTFHCDAQRLEASTVRGADAQRIAHTLQNLLRRIEPEKSVGIANARRFRADSGSAVPVAPVPAAPKQEPPKEEKSRMRKRQVLFEP